METYLTDRRMYAAVSAASFLSHLTSCLQRNLRKQTCAAMDFIQHLIRQVILKSNKQDFSALNVEPAALS
jgi:hypothetical protein